jgi:CHAT domain-containing protein
VLNRIRKLPGFAAFQAPTSIYELQNIAAQFGGPLVYAAATQHGTLILFVEAQGVRGVWTGLTNTRLSELLVRKRKDGRWTGFLPTQLGLGDILENSLRELLPVLEDQLVAPLREQLLRLSYKRVGLVLTGKLSLLPVSACPLDDVCVHLQVNGRSLSSAEDEARRRLGVETVLAVGNPLPSENPLPAAELEAAMAAAHFSQPTLMAGTAVGAIRVIEGLQSASHLHLACHGYLAAEDALQSALHLGGPNQLTVRDLLFGSSLPKSAKLAVLSACQSAVPDFARLPDEIIGLPVAFLQAGVPTVVGTLWPVADYSTALVMDRFYQAYIRDRVAPAEALRSAPQWLRSVTAGELETYFKAARRKAGTELDVPYEAVSAAWRYFLAMPPDSTPFKSPVYWAPFVCYGL